MPSPYPNMLVSQVTSVLLCSSSRSQYEAVKQKSDDETKKVAILEERHRAAAKTLTTLEREMESGSAVWSLRPVLL